MSIFAASLGIVLHNLQIKALGQTKEYGGGEEYMEDRKGMEMDGK
jgi:hypothetical protein